MCSLKCLMLRDLFLIEMYEWILLSHWFLFMYLSQAERIKWETLQDQHHMAKQKQKSGMLCVGEAVEQSVRCVCMCVLRSKKGEWFRNNRNGWRGNKMEIDNELNMFNKKNEVGIEMWKGQGGWGKTDKGKQKSHLIVFMNKSSQALMFAGKEPFPTIYVESQKEGEVCIIQFISHSLICQNCYTTSYDTVDKQEITWIKPQNVWSTFSGWPIWNWPILNVPLIWC